MPQWRIRLEIANLRFQGRNRKEMRAFGGFRPLVSDAAMEARTSCVQQHLANASALQFQPLPCGCLRRMCPHKAVQPPSLPEARPLHHHHRHDRRNWTCIQQTLRNLSQCKQEVGTMVAEIVFIMGKGTSRMHDGST